MKKKVGIRQSILLRIRLAFGAMLLFAFLILYRIWFIQFSEGDKWKRIAAENGLKYKEVEATRGNLLSDNGSLLATSLPFYRVAIDPVIADDEIFYGGIDSLAYLLEDFFDEKDAEDYIRELTDARLSKRRYRLLSRKYISYTDKKRIETWPIFNKGKLKGGIIFEKVERRFKPFGGLARRTIGFVREEDSTESVLGRGLEYSFNTSLAGKNGEALFQKISGGHWKPINDDSQVRPENGLDVQTTIDIQIQEIVHGELDAALRKNKASYGCAILMEVSTGEVKAIVNLGKTPEGKYVENYNYAIGNQGVTEPGSTFKLVSMMALLEEVKAMNIDDSVNTGDGQYMFYEDCIMTDAALYGYGTISVQEVFEKSSNIGTSKLVFKHFMNQPKKFINYIKKFGLYDPIFYQMQGAGKPFVSSPGDKTWSGCSLPWMSIGYELKLSPMQLLAFYNGVANDGKMLSPLIVKRVIRGNKTVQEYHTKVINAKLCSEKTLFTLQGMLEGVVERGTAKNIKSKLFPIAGKTGTTQKIKYGKYTQSYYTSFAGYFPADNPKYSCIVVIDDPRGDEQYGGGVAAPVFKEIAEKVYIKAIPREIRRETLTIQKAPQHFAGNYDEAMALTEELDIKQVSYNTEQWVKAERHNDTIRWVNTGAEKPGIMPDVRGMTLRDALYLLENNDLEVRFHGKGKVTRQSIPPGRKVRKGNQVYLNLSLGA